MAGFGEQLQAAAPMFLGIGSQLSGSDPMGIARGMALLQAKQESDKRKAAINNMLSGMGISGPEKAFIESMPEGMAQQEILRRMQPKPRNLQEVNGQIIDMDTLEVVGDFRDKPQPLPPGLFGEGGAGYNVGGGVRMEGVSDPAIQAWNTFASQWTGPALTVTSAYRDPEHNRRVGGAEKSQHLGGNAFDFSTAGWSLDEKKAALQLARDIGFTGAGIYGNAIHLDVGPPRVWGPSFSNDDAPDWAKDIMLGGGGGVAAPQQARATTPDLGAQIEAYDKSIGYLSNILATGAGTPAQRKELEHRRSRLEALRDDAFKRQQEATKAAGALPPVGAQEIFQNGTIVQSTPMGPRVWLADGTEVTGEAAQKAILEANNYEVSLANSMNYGRRAGTLDADIELAGEAEATRKAGAQAVDMSGEAFEAVGAIRTNIANLAEVRDLIAKGAETGPISQYFPNITAASTELWNVQSRLGLDVVGSVAFGALSDAELKFALSSALPVGLDGPELSEWVTRKINAQEKLVSYLWDQATFLSKPGNTLNDWLEKVREEGGAPADYSPKSIMGMSAAEIDGLISKGLNEDQYNAAVARLKQLAAGSAK